MLEYTGLLQSMNRLLRLCSCVPNPVPEEQAFAAIKAGVDALPPGVKMVLNSCTSSPAYWRERYWNPHTPQPSSMAATGPWATLNSCLVSTRSTRNMRTALSSWSRSVFLVSKYPCNNTECFRSGRIGHREAQSGLLVRASRRRIPLST